jgi:uncharacterized protein (DUF433 family)
MEPTIIQHIEKNPGVCGGKACVKGTRIRVQDIYVWHELQNRSPEEIVTDFPQLTLGDVHAALAYYWDHRDEIHQGMKDAEDLVEELKKQFPSKLREKLKGRDAGDAISSG